MNAAPEGREEDSATTAATPTAAPPAAPAATPAAPATAPAAVQVKQPTKETGTEVTVSPLPPPAIVDDGQMWRRRYEHLASLLAAQTKQDIAKVSWGGTT